MKQNGYTLIELLVVIVIVGVIGGLSIGIMVNMARSWKMGVDINTLQNQSEQAPAFIEHLIDQVIPETVSINDNGRSIEFSVERVNQHPKILHESSDRLYSLSRRATPVIDDVNGVIIECHSDHLVIYYDGDLVFQQSNISGCIFTTTDLGDGHDWLSLKYTLRQGEMVSTIEVGNAIY